MRKEQPGSAWSEAERAAHEQDCLELVRKGSVECVDVGAKAKKAKKDATLDGMASVHFGMELADQVHLITGRRLASYQIDGPHVLDKRWRGIRVLRRATFRNAHCCARSRSTCYGQTLAMVEKTVQVILSG